MSILIKGMGMPDSCFHCKLAEVCQHYKAEHYANERHEDCPLEEVPETHEKRTETHGVCLDTISRKVAIDALFELYEYQRDIDPTESADLVRQGIFLAEKKIEQLPSAQPEHTNSCYTNSWCIDCKEYDTENKCCPRYNRVIKQTLDEVYAHAETEAEARFHNEIVRCKNCKYNSNTCGNYVNCDIIPQMFGRTVDNFCSMAERRTDD